MWPAWPGPWRVCAALTGRDWRNGATTAGWSHSQLDDVHVVIRADFDYRDGKVPLNAGQR
jgi:hypothetical protein